MKILDGHIHIGPGPVDREALLDRMKAAGVEGGVLISLRPPTFRRLDGAADSAVQRLDNLLAWAGGSRSLHPFFWIDPMEDGALDQVSLAVERGAMGFKIICGAFYPGEARALKVYAAIARAGKPILFHSGILWDGQPSGPFNRPANFEALLEIESLRFSLAHISWPWCDELIAVYGKMINAARRIGPTVPRMFIDTTPGTPPIYRREALTKLFTVGYPVEDNVIFGVDSSANQYSTAYAREWIDRDMEILRSIGVSEATRGKVFAGNLEGFLGLTPQAVG